MAEQKAQRKEDIYSLGGTFLSGIVLVWGIAHSYPQVSFLLLFSAALSGLFTGQTIRTSAWRFAFMAAIDFATIFFITELPWLEEARLPLLLVYSGSTMLVGFFELALLNEWLSPVFQHRLYRALMRVWRPVYTGLLMTGIAALIHLGVQLLLGWQWSDGVFWSIFAVSTIITFWLLREDLQEKPSSNT